MASSEPSMRYLARLMEVLTTHDRISITNLAMLSRINHQRCGELLGRLERAGYVGTRMSKGRKYFLLTDRGKDSARMLLDVNHNLGDSLAGTSLQNVRT